VRNVNDEQPIKVLIAKPGLDGHDRGAKILALALRDAGMEVIYTGLHWRPEEIAAAAQQEDIDVVGLSILAGSHVEMTTRLFDELRARGVAPAVVVGGTIPAADVEELRALGVAGVFPVYSSLEEIVAFIERVGRRQEATDG